MSNDLLTTEDTLILDEMLGHEARCESTHWASNSRPCSITVTHRYRAACGGAAAVICTNSAIATQERIDTRPYMVCEACGPMPTYHWTVTPA